MFQFEWSLPALMVAAPGGHYEKAKEPACSVMTDALTHLVQRVVIMAALPGFLRWMAHRSL